MLSAGHAAAIMIDNSEAISVDDKAVGARPVYEADELAPSDGTLLPASAL
jgi:hypothetical protein